MISPWQKAMSHLSLIAVFTVMITGCGGGVSVDSQAANGGGPVASSPPATPPSSSRQLLWDAPTTNADGTALTDLAGYKIYYGASPGSYSIVVDVGNTTSYDFTNLPTGTYYFVITAYDTSNNESSYSNEVIKTL